MLRSWLRHSILLCLAAAATFATPQLTQIQDIIYNANGTLFDGVAQISWNSFVASDGSTVSQSTSTIRIVRGQLRVALVPTTDANQAVTYSVRFTSEGKAHYAETWAVPPSRSILRLTDIRVGGGGSAGNLTSSIGVTDVTGLRTELDMRPYRGTSWTPRKTAVIGIAGTLESAPGNDSDCVHVDGTSAPCGGGSAVTWVDAEVPSGALNGINSTFKLSAVPSPASSLRLFLNGLSLAQGVDYTVSAGNIAMTRPPSPSSIMLAWYRTSGGNSSFVDMEVPAGTVNGTNAAFTLQSAPLPAASLQLYRNGILLKAGLDYSLSGSTITFVPLSLPFAGDTLTASYRR